MIRGKQEFREFHNQQVHSIHVSDDIRISGDASPELIAEAVSYLHRDGILVLENAVDAGHLDTLQALLGPETLEIARNPHHHFNWTKENMDQAPPLMPKLMFDDVWANPIVVAICSAILGPNVVCHYANGNTALTGTKRQPVHADIDKPHVLFPFAYAVNIVLGDASANNGATEVWVGSHRDSNISQHDEFEGGYGLTIKQEFLNERRRHSPPIQPCTKKGDIILRDIRLWHAGMPNKTASPRIMLAFVLQPKWFQAPSKVLLPLKARDLVSRWQAETGLTFNAHWIDGDVDHRLISSDDVDFSTRNARLLDLDHVTIPPVY